MTSPPTPVSTPPVRCRRPSRPTTPRVGCRAVAPGNIWSPAVPLRALLPGSLGTGARCFEAGGVKETIVEMDGGIMLLMAISDGSALAVLASPMCDIGQVAYEMTLLVDRVGQILTPELRAQLQGGAGRMVGQPA